MPVLYGSVDNLEQTNESGYPNYAASGQIDLAMLMSEQIGKNVRQGQSFHVKQINIQLVGKDDALTDDFDVGGACTMQFKGFQTNKYARHGWNEAFKQWRRQKQLAGAVGSAIRNDDMEFAMNYGSITSRTSSIFRNMAASTSEKLVLGGASTIGQDWSLEDFVNTTLYPPQDPSKDHFNNSVYKENKFGDTRFPLATSVELTASQSAIATAVDGGILGIGSGDVFSGAVSAAGVYTFPRPLRVLCGLLSYNIILTPPDTVNQVEDNFFIRYQIHVVKTTPLVYRPKKRRSKAMYTRKGGKVSGRRYKRRK